MQEKYRRVVVRGVGLVSCLGVSVAETWGRLLRNECGLRPLEDAISVVGFNGPCRVGGSVSDQAIDERWQELENDQASLPGLAGRTDRRSMSRACVLGILAAHEALQQSGWLPDHNSSSCDSSRLNQISFRAGTYFSTGMEGVSEILRSQALMDERGYAGMGAHVLLRTLGNMPAAHISRAWGLRGPAMTCNTACASGLHSVGEAFRMIQHGEADMVLTGACEAPLNSWILTAFSRIRALSLEPDAQRASRPFDAARDGFAMAEGAAAMVLEAWPLPGSPSCQPPIAEILGFGRSSDAYSLVSPEPTGDGAFRSMKAALDDARIDSLTDLGHINCHATSTPAGDTTELAAIARLFAAYGTQHHQTQVQVNSVKGHLGHSLGAAGALEAVYCALAAKHGICVANRNLERPPSPDEIARVLERTTKKDEAKEISEMMFEKISFGAEPNWVRKGGRRRLVLTNSFGFGGTNASLVLSNWVD
uniref:beta-ketoacyl-[acyl-carrier-protein] synthase I n=1 Tax=Mesocestoides corti TaxID=53468 RepID=A0A5K3FMG6_MESCO